MIKLKQTKLTDPKKKTIGNSIITTYACFLDKEVKDCPAIEEHFNDEDSSVWRERLTSFLDDNGYEEIYYDDDPFKSGDADGYYFAWGESHRKEVYDHQVIFYKQELFHDPHPDGTGLKKINGYVVLESLDAPEEMQAFKKDMENLIGNAEEIKKLQDDANSNYNPMALKLDVRGIVNKAVLEGLQWGWLVSHKEGKPTEGEIKKNVEKYIMTALSGVIDFGKQEIKIRKDNKDIS